MASITTEQLQEWSELEIGKTYTIDGIQNDGEACILTMTDEKRVLAPSALTNRIKQENHKFPRHVKLITYNDFDIVWY